MTQATATEEALCVSWGQGLPTRSRADTQQTQDEIQNAYAEFVSACPAYSHHVPQ